MNYSEQQQKQQAPLSPRHSNEYNNDGNLLYKSDHSSPSALERKTMAITPPLDEIKTPSSMSDILQGERDDEQLPTCSYLLNLFTAPDMRSYLTQANFTEDVFMLPLHLQRLMSEAKEELVCARTQEEAQKNQKTNMMDDNNSNTMTTRNKPPTRYNATRRLERLREYVWARSGHDISNIMRIVNELMEDEDELINILNTEGSILR
ncbi:hypothetical protein BDA99DRAFT_492228 [Phascolomyces articulosus]|uniref:Uncharacterized protein n=1 Tax=Phascolomyces articulosus TaxID=60185 RepID=A0AAD5KBX3_9FUNG|nr:hypothetical protein BDA99DRAFT_492228 [Phascolomyces articulosus]